MKLKDQNGRLIAVNYQGSIYGQAGQGQAIDVVAEIAQGTIKELDNDSILRIPDSILEETQIEKVIANNCSVVGNGAFGYCYSLSEVELPLCESIGANAFTNCYNLKRIYIPLCKQIGGTAMQGCGFETIDLPSCETIDSQAFYGCHLNYISIPMCKTIKIGAFESARIKIIDAPSCTTLSSSAFKQCSELTRASFPMVSMISGYTFQSCYNLTDLYVGDSLDYVSSNAFSSTPFAGYSASTSKPATLWCPASKAEEYASKFGSIFSIISTY